MREAALVIGNWKMELSHKGGLEVIIALKKLLRSTDLAGTAVVVCPSFPSLPAIAGELAKEVKVAVGAQNVHWEEKGACTGSVSIAQIAPFVEWCIVGHSEQRKLTNMAEEAVGRTARQLLNHGIRPIVCIGESYEERSNGKTDDKIHEQMQVLLSHMTRTSLSRLVVAYEPIWAISANHPGSLPDPGDMAGTMLLIRKLAAVRFGNEGAQRMRVIYGGSVDAVNVSQFAREPGVDGVLVGKASIQPRLFVEIINTLTQISTKKA